MCGLVGIAGKLEYKDEATMKRLLLLDYLRGPDSTGLASVSGSTGEVKIAKLASHPLDLFEMPRFKTALNGAQSKVFIGHNRAATRGLVTSYNAHPYAFGDIVGAHNGTLVKEDTKELEKAIGETFAVDSQAIFAGIDVLGVENVIPMLETGSTSTEGAWSLVWYDGSDNSLNLLRNKHRPLWYAFTKNFDRIFWASEWRMIDAAVGMSAQGYDLYSEGKEGFRFFQTDEDVWYKFDLAALKAGGDSRPKPKAKKLKGKEPKPVAVTGSSYPFKERETGHHSSQTTTGRASTTTSRSFNTEKSVIHLIGDLHHPLAGFISEDKFNELAKYGCSFCGVDVGYNEVGVTIFERDDMILCPDCSGGKREGSRIYVKSVEGLV